jgi:hypothetical protein
MVKKAFKPEQIINKLRGDEVLKRVVPTPQPQLPASHETAAAAPALGPMRRKFIC